MKIKQNIPVTSISHSVDTLSYSMRIVEQLCSFDRVFGKPENDAAREFLSKEMTEIFGENPKIIGETKNIVIGDPATSKFLVGAHYDSVEGTPGADDNASAVAVMLSIAKNIKEDICFVAFNGEECNLLGSKEFVKSIRKNNKIKQVHILEMVGYRSNESDSQENPLSGFLNIPTIGNFVGVVSNCDNFLDQIIRGSNKVDIPVIGLSIADYSIDQINSFAPHLLRSDHTPFWNAGLSAVMWTDTAEFRNKNYHQPTDTPDTLDYEFMASVSQSVIETIKESC